MKLQTLVLALILSRAAVAGPLREKVVFQVSDSDPKKWTLALNNAKNLQHAFAEGGVDVEIVAYGPGVEMLKFDSIVGNQVNDLEAAGMKIVACQNTMKSLHLGQEDMLSSIGYVPAGVAEIVEKEREGWAYIRP